MTTNERGRESALLFGESTAENEIGETTASAVADSRTGRSGRRRGRAR